ncbi:MAG: replication-associated recombination protein A [Deltaproteobacteria bacterium]|nr:replication-associated recombination protein A [Deltaproteobacteria bacterium]
MDLFEHADKKTSKEAEPLAEKMRPRHLEEFVGQEDLVAKGSLLRNAIDEDRLFSMIFWGPPGSGKTTLARIISRETRAHFETFSAVLSGVKDVRQVIERAKEARQYHQKHTVLFVDELHRFNKAQQDAFLPYVENGLLTLIGATTENPSFEIIAPLLSRVRIMVLEPVSQEALTKILTRALGDKQNGLGKFAVTIEPDALDYIVWAADGDARTALNNLEAAASLVIKKVEAKRTITADLVRKALQKKALLYDKSGEEHYNLISALHKSLRGSDPDAALYWLGRMIAAGEDPLYIARRMVRFASEDIGNADPQALNVAVTAMQAFHFIGLPEGDLALAQAAVYLATAPKSNALYAGMGGVKRSINETGALPVPLHIRNAPTNLMKDLGYGKDYKYPDAQFYYHSKSELPHEDHLDYLPDKIKGKRFYRPTNRGYEKTIKERMEQWRRPGQKHDKKPS